MKWTLLTLGIFLAAALAAAKDARDPRMVQAETAVLEQMFDPGSAQFRSEQIAEHAKTTQGWAIAGEVNGKNRFGGYVGYRQFIYADGKATIYP